ncbi:MAG: biopolymer transporter ExbD [Marinobacter sp.]|uniref:ExbD/TolR family protein n=1 Tax=Marinobacter sp. TaxID=50741 RepID=UPI00299D54E7|nr:biopolymer transporter ExbD [Marinobacter sp.]MDX1633683.1 biopolymer transporter ExbD [Marinobacter sp.]
MSDLLPPPPGSGKGLLDRVEDSLLPLINLVFLLLMFFIVAGQMSEARLPELPPIAGQGGEQGPRADLMMAADGRLRVAGQSVEPANLGRVLPEPRPEEPLRLAAHRDVTMAELEALFRRLETVGHTDVLLLTEPQP